MTAKKPYLQHLTAEDDLVTPYSAVRAGFVAQALEKNRRAIPFVAQAKALKAAALTAAPPSELLNLEELHPALLAAAGVSDKAASHLDRKDQVEAISSLIRNFLEPAGDNFVEELVFRFLLTRGDSLGGSMRNVGGVPAQRKLTRALISTLTVSGRSYQWLHSANKAWAEMTGDDSDIELHLRGLNWQTGNQPRTLLYNFTVPLVKNNVDLCLFNCSPGDLLERQSAQIVYSSPASYLALGELKGGIDPAGADEHWKTALTALNRIQAAFSAVGFKPYAFFVAAAVEKKMANEIWNLLHDGTLENAANLTSDHQIAGLSRWLCHL